MQGENRILIPSSKVSSYEEKPEMSAFEITGKLLPEIARGFYDFVLVNYANGDLVGHSANMQAGIKACEVVDRCVGQVVDEGLKNGYTILITGDHGNIETMFYPDGEPNPSHGTNQVPIILISRNPELQHVKLREGLGLSCISPTILKLMGIPKPLEMTAESLF
jgi:2,3-bisphosphoglycerate-independent phosphoglycerate mutase